MKGYIDTTTDYGLMQLAHLKATGSSCNSRKVGCVLVLKEPRNTLLVSYNEMPEAIGRCIDYQQCRCFDPNRESGKDLDKCYATHAEAKAITQAIKLRVSTVGATAVVTDLPCNECAKLLIEAGIDRVIYDRDYPHSKSKWMFEQSGVSIENVSVGVVT